MTRARLISRVAAVLFVLALGGCDVSGCQGRGASVPIPSGFPVAERVSRAGQARITSHGFETLGQMFAKVIAPYDVNTVPLNFDPSSYSYSGVTSTICHDVGCAVQYEVLDATLAPEEEGSNRIELDVRILRRSFVDGSPAGWPITSNGFGNCHVTLNQEITLSLSLTVEESTSSIREDFTVIDFDPVTSAPNIVLSASCSGLMELAWGAASPLVVAYVNGAFLSATVGRANQIIDESTCQPATLGCPDGSFALPDGFCHTTVALDSPCVRRLNGEDLRGDLGAALLGLPHSGAFGEYLLAAVGDGEGVQGGMSFDLSGGLRSTNESFAPTGDIASGQDRPHICVPPSVRPPPPNIPILNALQSNELPGTDTPYDIGIGLSDEWLSYLAFELYESGALCITTSDAQSPSISPALVPSLADTLRALTFPDEHPSLRIVMRPQAPPRLDATTNAEGDAVLIAAIDTVFVDIELFVQERYTRLLTYIVHPRLELEPRVEGTGVAFDVSRFTTIAPSSIGNLHAASVDEQTLVAELDTHALEMFVALFRSVPGISLPSVPGASTSVVPGGIQTIEQGGQGFFVIFCELTPSP